MSVVTISQIARKVWDLYEPHVGKEDLSRADPEYETKVRTRCLAAFAVQTMTECTDSEAGASVIDGGDDNGIDAIFYSQSHNKLVMVQSKWIKDGNSEPDSGEVGKFCQGVRDLVNSNFERFNSKLQRRQASIETALSTFNCRIQLILVHTGRDELAKHATQLVDDVTRLLNDAADLATFSNLPQKEVYRRLAEGAAGGSINLDLSLTHWGKTEAPHHAFYGMLSGLEVRSWWVEHGEHLFDKNLRSVLGPTDVNKQIADTLQNRPEDFWYFNNGITIIAKGLEKTAAGSGSRDVGVFRATNAHIVNGAQTVSTIGRFSGSDEHLAKVMVPARVISLEEAGDEYGAAITRTNNTQNRIESRDFVSQDLEQHRLRMELQLDGVEYHISRSENFRPNDVSFDLEEATIAAASAAGESSLAVQLKREIGRFWVDLDKAPYKRLFNAHTSSRELFHSVQISRVVEIRISSLIRGLERRSGKKHGVLVHGNRLLAALVFSKLPFRAELAKETFEAAQNVGAINELVDEVAECLADEVERRFPDNFMAVVFKNPSKCDELFKACSQRRAADQPKLIAEAPSETLSGGQQESSRRNEPPNLKVKVARQDPKPSDHQRDRK